MVGNLFDCNKSILMLGRFDRRRSFSNIMSLIKSEPELSIFEKALELTDLSDSLATGGPFTVFAPTNFAFDGINSDRMLANIDRKVEMGLNWIYLCYFFYK